MREFIFVVGLVPSTRAPSLKNPTNGKPLPMKVVPFEEMAVVAWNLGGEGVAVPDNSNDAEVRRACAAHATNVTASSIPKPSLIKVYNANILSRPVDDYWETNSPEIYLHPFTATFKEVCVAQSKVNKATYWWQLFLWASEV